MPSYADLTVAGGASIASVWGNKVRDSSIIVCTSSTRPGSPHEGMTVYESDTQATMQYTGAAWGELVRNSNIETVVPYLYQGASVIGPNAPGDWETYFERRGGWVSGEMWIKAGMSGTAGQVVSVETASAPVLPLLNGHSGYCCGSFLINNGTIYTGSVNAQVVGSYMRFYFYTNATASAFGAAPSVGLVNTNQVSFNFKYRVA